MYPNDSASPNDEVHEHVPLALQDAANAFPGPPTGLVEAAIARGRRKRRSRAIGSAALATVAGLAVVGIAAATGSNLAGGRIAPAAAGTAYQTTATSPGGGRIQAMPASEIDTKLEGLLPPHVTVTVVDGQTGYLGLIGADSVGRSLIEINVQQNVMSKWFTCAARTVKSGDTCSQTTLPDGARQVVVKGPSLYGGPCTEWTIDLIRPNGDRVVIDEWNALSDAGAVTRPTPILTLDQVEAIVDSPTWQE